MAHTRHRKKTLRKAEAARLKNRAERSDMRTAVKKSLVASAAVAVEGKGEGEGDPEAALRAATKRLDKAAKQGLIHKNTASRAKSRLARAKNAGAK